MDRGRITALRDGDVDFSIGVFEDIPATSLRSRDVHLPLALPRFTISLVWHRRQDGQAEHPWMNEALVRAIRNAREATRARN
jgi:hypothetical protein